MPSETPEQEPSIASSTPSGANLSILDEYAAYTDPTGMVSGEKNPERPAGNAILFTSEAQFILGENCLFGIQRQRLIDLIDKNCQLEIGLYERFRGTQDNERQDDYIGLAAASWLLSTEHAGDIIDHGTSAWLPWNRWYYGEPGLPRDWLCWFYRFPAVIAHFYWSARRRPWPLQRLFWCASVAFSPLLNTQDEDSWILNWLMIQVVPKNPWTFPEQLAIRIYKHRLKRFWPGGLKSVFARYFNDPEHPTAKYFNDPPF